MSQHSTSFFIPCPTCKGSGKKRQRVKKSIRLQYQKALEVFKNTKSPEPPPIPPKGALSICKDCRGTGLVSSNTPALVNSNYPHIAIVGAGIGGTALALACSHRGIPFTLYERDLSFDARAQGYGLTLQQASKAMKALGINRLDDGIVSTLHQVFSTDGNLIGEWGMRKWLNAKNYKPNKKTNIHIARQNLRAALMKQLGGEHRIKWNHQFINYVENNNQSLDLTFKVGDDKVCTQADILVGADGIRSAVRKQMLGDLHTPLQYLGCMVILGICPLTHLKHCNDPLLDLETVFQTANGRERIYMMPYDKKSIMWQLSFPIEEEDAKKLSNSGAEALKQTSIQKTPWHNPIPDIMHATPSAMISGYPVYDRAILDENIFPEKLPITMIGDAAHPMSPFKGQGANQALIDALYLARMIYQHGGSYHNLKKDEIRKFILNQFEKEMIHRTAAKVKDSAEAAKFLHSDLVLLKANEPRGRCLKRKP